MMKVIVLYLLETTLEFVSFCVLFLIYALMIDSSSGESLISILTGAGGTYLLMMAYRMIYLQLPLAILLREVLRRKKKYKSIYAAPINVISLLLIVVFVGFYNDMVFSFLSGEKIKLLIMLVFSTIISPLFLSFGCRGKE